MDSNRNKYKSIFKEVLKEIKPSEKENDFYIDQANEIVERLEKVLPKDTEVRVVGSLARGTNLKGNSDVDIFILFDKKLGKEKAVEKGIESIKKIIKKEEKYEMKYAEHPYIRLYLNSGLRADIVPALKIDSIEELATAVDRTPLHNKFLLEHFNEKQKDEVRLLKQFLKAHGIYGSEIKTRGFSGYLSELLIYFFGDFLSVLEYFSKAKLPILLDPKNKLFLDNSFSRKFESEFVVIDPIDPDRNVAASVSIESLARFAIFSRLFLKDPKVTDFYVKGYSKNEAESLIKSLSDMGIEIIIIEFNIKEKSEDIIIGELNRLALILKEQLEEQGFLLYKTIDFLNGNKGYIALITDKYELLRVIRPGPDAFIAQGAEEFLNKHSFVFIDNSKLYAIEKTLIKNIKLASLMILKNLKNEDIDTNNARIVDKEKILEPLYFSLIYKFLVVR